MNNFFNSFFAISSALAEDGHGFFSGHVLGNFIPMILIVLVFYFLLLRPQQKRMKEHKEMINNLKKNDHIIFSNGIFGKVVRIDKEDSIIYVEVAENVRIKVRKESVTDVLATKEVPNQPEKAKKIQVQEAPAK